MIAISHQGCTSTWSDGARWLHKEPLLEQPRPEVWNYIEVRRSMKMCTTGTMSKLLICTNADPVGVLTRSSCNASSSSVTPPP
jgi:hypothetical protein